MRFVYSLLERVSTRTARDGRINLCPRKLSHPLFPDMRTHSLVAEREGLIMPDMGLEESISDDYVAELLKKDAKDPNIRFSALGLYNAVPSK